MRLPGRGRRGRRGRLWPLGRNCAQSVPLGSPTGGEAPGGVLPEKELRPGIRPRASDPGALSPHCYSLDLLGPSWRTAWAPSEAFVGAGWEGAALTSSVSPSTELPFHVEVSLTRQTPGAENTVSLRSPDQTVASASCSCGEVVPDPGWFSTSERVPELSHFSENLSGVSPFSLPWAEPGCSSQRPLYLNLIFDFPGSSLLRTGFSLQ